MTNSEVLGIFFSRIYEHDIHEKILDDIDFVIPFDRVKDFVLRLIGISYTETLIYLDNHFSTKEISSGEITQSSSLLACTDEMCIALSQDENRGKSFVEIGQSEIFEKYVSNKNLGAWRKYGENQVKTAEQLGLAFEYFNLWYLSCFGYIYPSLDEVQKKKLLARTILRNPLYADIICNIKNSSVDLADYMGNLSLSTQKRRVGSVLKLLKFCFDEMISENIPRENLYFSINHREFQLLVASQHHCNSSDFIRERFEVGTIPLYSVKAACGNFENNENPEIEGWLDVHASSRTLNPFNNFAVYAKGNSMLPKIKNGDICIFKKYSGEDANGCIVLTQCRDFDSEYDSKYTIKRFHCDYSSSRKEVSLLPLNKDGYNPIVLNGDDNKEYKIIGIFIDIFSPEFVTTTDSLGDSEFKYKSVSTVKTPQYYDFEQRYKDDTNYQICRNYILDIKFGNRNGKKAPHKIILLLAVMNIVAQNLMSPANIKLSVLLEREFKVAWDLYVGSSSTFSCNVAMPFWHMNSEPFWSLCTNDGSPLESISNKYSIRVLREKTYARLNKDFISMLGDPERRECIKKLLVEMLK